MEELLEKLDNLKKGLDKEECIKRIKKLNKEIQKEEGLINLVKLYKKYPEENLKDRIYKNKLYKEYKETETDINILILKINNKLKTITNKENCI